MSLELIESEANSGPRTNDDISAEEHDPELSGNGNGNGRQWLRIVALILLAAVIIFLLVLLARWIYHEVHGGTQTKTGTSQEQKKGQSGNSSSGASDQGSPAALPGGTSGGANNSNTGSNNQASLPNNGPGDVAAIFVGASLAAAGLHYIVSLRRFARSES